MCALQVTRHTSIRYSSSCHTRIKWCWQVCGKNLNIILMCAMSPVVHTSNISSCQKKLFQFSCGCEKFPWGRSFGFLVINVCNHREHYETPCIELFHVSALNGTNKNWSTSNAEIMEWNNFYLWHHSVLFFIVTAGGLPIHVSHIFNEILEYWVLSLPVCQFCL